MQGSTGQTREVIFGIVWTIKNPPIQSEGSFQSKSNILFECVSEGFSRPPLFELKIAQSSFLQ
jgi:hypothetical protein